MQGWTRPQGTDAARTYWLRRLVVLVILGVLGLALWWLTFGRPHVPDQPQTTAREPSPTPTSSATVTPSPEGPCSPRDLKLAVSIPETITPGKEVPLTLSVTNIGSRACEPGLNPQNFALALSKDEDIIWASTECERRLGTLPTGMLAPQQGAEWTSRWPGKKAGSKCALTDDVLASGVYQLNATIVDGPTVQRRFTLD